MVDENELCEAKAKLRMARVINISQILPKNHGIFRANVEIVASTVYDFKADGQ